MPDDVGAQVGGVVEVLLEVPRRSKGSRSTAGVTITAAVRPAPSAEASTPRDAARAG